MFFQLPRICHWNQYNYNSICFVSALLLLVVSMLTPAPQLRKYRSRQGIYATHLFQRSYKSTPTLCDCCQHRRQLFQVVRLFACYRCLGHLFFNHVRGCLRAAACRQLTHQMWRIIPGGSARKSALTCDNAQLPSHNNSMVIMFLVASVVPYGSCPRPIPCQVLQG